MAETVQQLLFKLLLGTGALFLVGWLTGCSSPAYTLTPDPTPYVRYSPTEYFLYLPSSYTPARGWPLFVGIHGFGHDGRQCLHMWQEYAEKESFVLVCPSLADENGGWYVDVGERTLRKIIQQVRKEVRAQDRFFLVGFSAGAEFVQGFAFDHPEMLTAVAILSSGNYYEPSLEARGIPFLVVIGDQDNPISLQNANAFVDLLREGKYAIDFHLLPGVKHEITRQAEELTIAFYRQVYRITSDDQ